MPAILPHRRRIVVPSFVGLLLVSALASADQPPPPSDDSGVLRIDVLQIQNDKGQVGCSLYSKPDGFPSDSKKALQSMFVKPKDKKAVCTFRDVKPGTYAVSIMHDLDKSGDLETSLVGRPKEPWGVSNDVPAERFGPPKYEAATFKYSGKATTLKIKLHE